MPPPMEPREPLSPEKVALIKQRWKWSISSIRRWIRIRHEWGRLGKTLQQEWARSLFSHLDTKHWGQATWPGAQQRSKRQRQSSKEKKRN